MKHVTSEQVERLLQFWHPEKLVAGMPGADDAFTDEVCANLLGVELEIYQEAKSHLVERSYQAAKELLADSRFAVAVNHLPFADDSTIVGVGDSITEDGLSWLQLLERSLELGRPNERFHIINAGASGDTTTRVISRFMGDVAICQPDWIICLIGTNDAIRLGDNPTKCLVSLRETKANLALLREFAHTHINAHWVWMTPPPVLESKIKASPLFTRGLQQWKNADIAAIAQVVREQPGEVVDLYQKFAEPPREELMQPNGLHPSLEGQKLIVKALIERLGGA
jgi:acyl-CoA thioesterase I